MWERLFDHIMRGFVRVGRVDVQLADGTTRTYSGADGPSVSLRFHDPDLPRKLVLTTDMALGEGYMDGRLTIGDDDLRGFLTFLTVNVERSGHLWWRRSSQAARRARRRFDQWNPAHRARQNVAHHYDLSATLYDLFLDEDRQYSCAYFRQPEMSLEEAQAAKKAHIARKLLLEPGMRVFEIGCGWGGLALSLARDHGAEVLGVTLSTEQHAWATKRAEAEGLSDKVKFELRDYRDVTGQFDRIVSVGMFEHVGVPHYRTYFDTVRDRLTEDGVALIHTIGRAAPPGTTSPWITKYIFPGGYVPALSEMSRAFEAAGLFQTDIEVWRLHYAETLRHWLERFEAKSDAALMLYDERFVRMWRYYLAASEMAFRHGRQCVFQVQLARDKQAVPLTRDYMA
ncbi:SAM-dependent methyltransferase [Alterinioella nitratireducens]|uniref:SAM-dependent methyltransferase n=1 Tax=Alterinioella nitratireducens TaxID=2735915 RepID=UPI001552C0B3|nr:cyclopropane-fatty-acyl-phospholipid synthase family protein [Alterinioella nitratireducens]NPD18011.1 class I SAM-dependent methyltransferase [Alterinioella nitratireducens]